MVLEATLNKNGTIAHLNEMKLQKNVATRKSLTKFADWQLILSCIYKFVIKLHEVKLFLRSFEVYTLLFYS